MPLQNDPLILGQAWLGPIVGPIKTPFTEKSENYCLWLFPGGVYHKVFANRLLIKSSMESAFPVSGTKEKPKEALIAVWMPLQTTRGLQLSGPALCATSRLCQQ